MLLRMIVCIIFSVAWSQHFQVNLTNTGQTQLTLLQSSISNLSPGDEIGIIDANAITNYNNCDNTIDELLVGAGIWTGDQLNIVSIGSVDMCAFGGVQISGFVSGNPVKVKVYKPSTNLEYETNPTWALGTGEFGDIIQAISEIELIDSHACEDDDETMGAFGGCLAAVSAVGCDFIFAGTPVYETCPITCDTCPSYGCTDEFACNFNPDAETDDGSCWSPVEDCTCDDGIGTIVDECGICGGSGPVIGFDCAGNCIVGLDCLGECGGEAKEDNCGICDENFENDCEQDCAGEWGGDATYDDCGDCNGQNLNMDCAGTCAPWTPIGDYHESIGLDYGAQLDECDICSGGESGHIENSDIDECGICFGDGIPVGDCDCNGNVYDECGICGGDGSDCGDGGGSDDGGTDPGADEPNVFLSFGELGGIILTNIEYANATSNELCLVDPVLSGASGELLITELGDCTPLSANSGTVSVYILNYVAISGFQFSFSDADIVTASGGAASDTGMMVSASGSMVLGFSMTGSTIGAQDNPDDNIEGCLISDADNYNPDATTPCNGNNSCCIFSSDCNMFDPESWCYNPDTTEDGDSDITMYECRDGSFVLSTAECNEVEDCQDGSDESFCEGDPGWTNYGDECSSVGLISDCNGMCFEFEYALIWMNDGVCDDGETWPVDLNCDTFNFDGGDCDDESGIEISYEDDIQPIFDANCTLYCHTGGGGYNGGLDLTSYDDLMLGTSNNGPVINPGYANYSILIQKLSDSPPFGGQMPPNQPPLDESLISMISDWINAGAIGPDGAGPTEDIYGCTNPIAENYNPEATIDDGSCIYPPLGELSFSTFLDSPNDEIDYASFNIELDCEYDVSQFEIEISGIEIINIVGLNQAASFELTFTDSTIVGTSTGEFIPANGSAIIEVHHESSIESLIDPTICFDDSKITTYIGIEYEAILGDCETPGCTDDLMYNYNSIATYDDDSCIEASESTMAYSISLHAGLNLISFYALPEDNSIGNLLTGTCLDSDDNIVLVSGILTEGMAGVYNPVLGWVGSLSEILCTMGYWIKVDEECNLNIDNSYSCGGSQLIYDLHPGPNLISFPDAGEYEIEDAIPDEFDGSILGIIGEGVAAAPNPNLGWVGSLSTLQGTKGYWFKSTEAISFSFDLSNPLSRVVNNEIIEYAQEYAQSTQQAFYFIEDVIVEGEPIEVGDWIIATHHGDVVGARQWVGQYTDIPVMGIDGQIETSQYIDVGHSPEFWVVKESSGLKIKIQGAIQSWQNNGLYFLNTMVATTIPDEFVLLSAYPNPFNPITRIEFGLDISTHVQAVIYDISGRVIETLVNGDFKAGFHEVEWNGEYFPSGIYFVSIYTEFGNQTQKLMLIK